MRLTIATPSRFSFRSTVLSHGWADLPPYEFDHTRKVLARPLSIGGDPVTAEFSQKGGALIVSLPSVAALAPRRRKNLIAQARAIFRLDEPMTGFYTEANRYPEFRWVKRLGAGRLLRAPSVFEDVVKMICTTNCSWALTKTMTGNLCAKVGHRPARNGAPFPSAAQVAALSEKFLRKEIRAGYRSPYILELARRVDRGELPVEEWRNGSLSPEELHAQIRSVKGVGAYAHGNILKLLGRYDELGIDSWCRKKFSEMYRRGRPVSDRVIEKHYSRFGKWKGLFFWLDLTGEWYRKTFAEIFGG